MLSWTNQTEGQISILNIASQKHAMNYICKVWMSTSCEFCLNLQGRYIGFGGEIKIKHGIHHVLQETCRVNYMKYEINIPSVPLSLYVFDRTRIPLNVVLSTVHVCTSCRPSPGTHGSCSRRSFQASRHKYSIFVFILFKSAGLWD